MGESPYGSQGSDGGARRVGGHEHLQDTAQQLQVRGEHRGIGEVQQQPLHRHQPAQPRLHQPLPHRRPAPHEVLQARHLLHLRPVEGWGRRILLFLPKCRSIPYGCRVCRTSGQHCRCHRLPQATAAEAPQRRCLHHCFRPHGRHDAGGTDTGNPRRACPRTCFRGTPLVRPSSHHTTSPHPHLRRRDLHPHPRKVHHALPHRGSGVQPRN